MKINILTFVILAACSSAYAQNTHADIIKEKSFKNSSFLMIYNGGYHVQSGKVVKSDLIVTDGDLIVDGALEGEAFVDNGNLVLHETGSITGKVTIIDGRVIVHNNELDEGLLERTSWNRYAESQETTALSEDKMAVVVPELPDLPNTERHWDKKMDKDFRQELDDVRKGLDAVNKEIKELPKIDVDADLPDDSDVEINGEDWEERRWSRHVRFRYPTRRDYRITEYDNGPIAFDYNRVDGLYLGAKMDRRNDRFKFKPLRVYGEIGYAFNEKDLRYQVGLDRRWGRAFRFEVGGEVHDLTTSQDTWIVGHLENAFNALLFKNDYKDHFRTRGYSFHVSQNLNPNLRITGIFKQDDYFSLQNNVNWAVFMPNQDFRTNPAIDDGRLTGLTSRVELDNVQYVRFGKRSFRRTGWHIVAEGEKSVPGWDSDFDFARYTVSVTRYQPLSKWENLDMRLFLGTSTGDLPSQKSYYAGGLSTLRGHDYKEFTGNNVALLNMEYRISPARFGGDRVLFFHPMNFILFMDNGYAWNSDIRSYRNLYRGFDMNKVETDIGVGLGDEKDILRLDIAKNVSRRGSDYKMMLRVNYAF